MARKAQEAFCKSNTSKTVMTSHFVKQMKKTAKIKHRRLQMHFLQKEFALGLGDPRFLEKRPAASIFTKMVLIIDLLNINPETLIFEC